MSPPGDGTPESGAPSADADSTTGRPRSLLDALLVALALVAFGLAGTLAIAPDVLPPAVTDPILALEDAIDPELAVLALGALVGLFALWRSYFSGASDVRDGAAPETVERTPSTDVSIVGQGTSERVDRSIAALERGGSAETEPIREDLRDALTAVEVARGRSPEVAGERIETGAWTDDRIAATFLGDERAGRLTLWHRLRAWLFPARSFEARLERTLAELEAYADARRGAGDGGRKSDSSVAEGVDDRQTEGGDDA